MGKEILTGAELVIRTLEFLKVSTVFGLPGGAILPAYDPLYDSPIRHVLVRHEQGAGHMAEGYAQATGELGVVIATSGPGATNLITPLANALMDSTPILAITGQVASTAIGNDAFQEAYTVGLTMAATKHNYLITKASEIPKIIQEAKFIATTGRPGPVLVDIPKDILNEEAEWIEPELEDLPGYKPTLEANPKMIQQAVDLIINSKNIDPTRSRCIVLNPNTSFDTDKGESSEPYTKIDIVEKERYIQDVLSKQKLDYERENEPKPDEIKSLLQRSYERFERKRTELRFSSETSVIIKLSADEFILVSCDGTGWKIVDSKQLENYKKYVRLTLDTKLLKWILMGPKFAHWNVAENGSHISFDREPNVYERGLYY